MNNCSVLGVETLSKSSLFAILKDLKPTERAIVCCLDKFLVEGEDAFEELVNIIKEIKPEEDKTLISCLRKAETYIKINLVHHLSTEASCVSHCISCALSDDSQPEKSQPCATDHTQESCPECTNENILDTVETLVNNYSGKTLFQEFTLETE